MAMSLPLAGPAPAEALDCQRITFEDVPLSTCTVDLATDDLRLWLEMPEGGKFRSLGRLADHLAAQGERLGFAMNAGMYHEDRSPVGLLILEGETRRGIVTSAGPGNFGMLPNGVFCWGAGRARVIESRVFKADPPDCNYATQSGPMLVIDGALHPRFLPDSTSFRIRNGVGVRADGTVVFALSERPVSFHRFARAFRDGLATPDALYLDGSISRMHAPSMDRADRGGAFGPILGVVTPE